MAASAELVFGRLNQSNQKTQTLAISTPQRSSDDA